MGNLAILRGNIGSMEELKRIGDDNFLLKFTLATNKRIKSEDKTTWHRCLAWGKTAELISQYFSKGDQIYLQGEIDNGSYDDKEGRKVYTSEIVVDKFEFCERKSDGKQNQSPQNSQGSAQNSGSSWGTQNNNVDQQFEQAKNQNLNNLKQDMRHNDDDSIPF